MWGRIASADYISAGRTAPEFAQPGAWCLRFGTRSRSDRHRRGAAWRPCAAVCRKPIETRIAGSVGGLRLPIAGYNPAPTNRHGATTMNRGISLLVLGMLCAASTALAASAPALDD